MYRLHLNKVLKWELMITRVSRAEKAADPQIKIKMIMFLKNPKKAENLKEKHLLKMINCLKQVVNHQQVYITLEMKRMNGPHWLSKYI